MGNKKPLNQFVKGDPKQKEIAKKGGQAKKGYKSFKNILQELLENGEIDAVEFVKAQALSAMEGNSGISKILWEYNSGKVKDELELNGNIQTDTTLSIKDYKKVREEMLQNDDV